MSIHIALIYGSTRKGRFCDTVGRWAAAEMAKDEELTVDLVDPAVPGVDPAEMRERLERADGFVVVTPEYNHSYPAPLKQLIDSVSKEWQAKPVAFISYGGVSGGLRAVEHLRGVFAELHAVTVRDSVSFANAPALFNETGQLRETSSGGRSIQVMLKRLKWWAAALRTAREAAPYGEAA